MSDIDTSNMSEEELEAYYKSRKELAANHKSEAALMLENGNIMFSEKGALSDGQPVHGNRDIKPEEADYGEICKSFNLSKPGESWFKNYERVDEGWKLVSEGIWIKESKDD